MRKPLTILASVVLAYCGYQLLSIPTGDRSVFEALWAGGVRTYTITAFVALATIIALSYRNTRTIYEERRLEDMRQGLQEYAKYIDSVEGRHRGLDVTKAAVAALIARADNLTDPSRGIPACIRQIDQARELLTAKLDHAAGGSIEQLIAAFERAESIFAKRGGRIAEAERRLAQLPALEERARLLEKRLTDLTDGGSFKSLNAITAITDSFTDDAFEEKLEEVEAGDPDTDGDLEDQVTELGERLDTAEARIEEVEEKVGTLVELKRRAEDIKKRFDELTARDLAGSIEEMSELADALLDEDGDDGSILAIENGSADREGTLAEQLSSLEDDLNAIEERLEAIDESDTKINDLRKSLAQVAAKFARVQPARSVKAAE
jgi:DNA repair exonuclease SbcCD ATPase subunit